MKLEISSLQWEQLKVLMRHPDMRMRLYSSEYEEAYQSVRRWMAGEGMLESPPELPPPTSTPTP